MTRTLPGIVSTVVAPQDAARASEAHKEAVYRAAVAYVAAWIEWNERDGYAAVKRDRLVQSQRELVRAVEGLGSADKQH